MCSLKAVTCTDGQVFVADCVISFPDHHCPPKAARKATNWLLGPSDLTSNIGLFDNK